MREIKNEKNSLIWYKFNGSLRYILVHTVTNIFPLYVLNEYPKSGGSWIGEMLSEALDIPFPRNRLPLFGSSILHGHMMHKWNMNNVLIVWRDGRDVLISQYYHSLFKNEKGNARLVEQCRADLQFDDYDDIENNLLSFMKYVYERSKHPRFTWTDFVNNWYGNKNCINIKYEDMRFEPEKELLRVIRQLSGHEISVEKIIEIVEKHSFKKMTGRDPGEESANSFMRKGVVGDWKNYFNSEAKVQFNKYAGDALIKLGYEKDKQWVSE